MKKKKAIESAARLNNILKIIPSENSNRWDENSYCTDIYETLSKTPETLSYIPVESITLKTPIMYQSEIVGAIYDAISESTRIQSNMASTFVSHISNISENLLSLATTTYSLNNTAYELKLKLSLAYNEVMKIFDIKQINDNIKVLSKTLQNLYTITKSDRPKEGEEIIEEIYQNPYSLTLFNTLSLYDRLSKKNNAFEKNLERILNNEMQYSISYKVYGTYLSSNCKNAKSVQLINSTIPNLQEKSYTYFMEGFFRKPQYIDNLYLIFKNSNYENILKNISKTTRMNMMTSAAISFNEKNPASMIYVDYLKKDENIRKQLIKITDADKTYRKLNEYLKTSQITIYLKDFQNYTDKTNIDVLNVIEKLDNINDTLKPVIKLNETLTKTIKYWEIEENIQKGLFKGKLPGNTWQLEKETN